LFHQSGDSLGSWRDRKRETSLVAARSNSFILPPHLIGSSSRQILLYSGLLARTNAERMQYPTYYAALNRFDRKAGISLRGISGEELPLRTYTL
jgi:hypothetical protein